MGFDFDFPRVFATVCRNMTFYTECQGERGRLGSGVRCDMSSNFSGWVWRVMRRQRRRTPTLSTMQTDPVSLRLAWNAPFGAGVPLATPPALRWAMTSACRSFLATSRAPPANRWDVWYSHRLRILSSWLGQAELAVLLRYVVPGPHTGLPRTWYLRP